MPYADYAPCAEGVIRSGAATAVANPEGAAAKPWVLAAAVLGSSVASILSSVVNVALPAIQHDFGASAVAMQWVLNAYLLPLGALILVGGAAGDRFGLRRVFLLGAVLFTGASVACGLAPSVGWLIGARVAQGVAGAMMVPASLALISAFFPEGERGQAIGTWAGVTALTSAVGPLLGGGLVDAGSWRWVFFIIVPIAAATVVLTLWRVPAHRPNEHVKTDALDWSGAVLGALGLAALVYGLVAQSGQGWSPLVLGLLGVGIMLLAAFLWRERTAKAPMLPLGLFRSSAFSGANALTVALYFAIGGLTFLLPFNLIQVQGYSATAAGAAFLPFTVIMGGLSRWMGGQISQFGARKLLTVGPLIAAVGLALFALPGVGGSYWTTFFPAMVVLAFGMTIAVPPLVTVVMEAVAEDHAGTASGINNAAARVAQLLAVAMLGAVALSLFGTALDAAVADLALSSEAQQVIEAARSDFAGVELPAALPDDEQVVLETIIGEAFVLGFRWTIGIAALLALLAAVVAWRTIPAEKGG